MNGAAGLLGEMAAAFVSLLLVLAFFGMRSGEDRRALFRLGVSSFLLRAALVLIYFWILDYGGRDGFAFEDSIKYHTVGSEMAAEIAEGLPHRSRGWGFKDPAYPFMCALLYIVFGSSTFVARFFNAAIGAMTTLYVYRIAKTAFDERTARIAATLWAFLPYPIFLTINQVKDGWVIFLGTFLFWHAYRVTRELPGWPLSLAFAFLGLIPMYFLREGFILPFLAAMLVSFVLTQRSIPLGLVLGGFVFIGLAVAQAIAPEEGEFTLGRSLGTVDYYFQRQATESQQGGLLRFVKMTSFYEIYKLPIAAFLLTILPFPPIIQPGKIDSTLMSFVQLVSVLLLPQLLLGVRECLRPGVWRSRLPILIYAGLFVAVLGALRSGNIRYRETVVSVLVILIAAGLCRRQNALWIGSIYFGLVLLAGLVYTNRFL